jgi:hypothetical protein
LPGLTDILFLFPGGVLGLLKEFSLIVYSKTPDMEQQNTSNLFDLQLDQQSSDYLGETARWAKFLSIIGFILCGLLVILGVFMGSFIAGSLSSSMNFGPASMLGGGFFTFLYVAFALVYFFPCLYLYQFSSKMRVALQNNDQVMLNTSLRSLKSCFKYFGILAIVVLGLYALALVAGILGAAIGR